MSAYSGNPHEFGGGPDPHAFHVVGGGFMNSGGGGVVKTGAAQAMPDEDGLVPFFADDGSAPWEAGQEEEVRKKEAVVVKKKEVVVKKEVAVKQVRKKSALSRWRSTRD